MKRERRTKLTRAELGRITSRDLVIREIRPKKPKGTERKEDRP